MHTFNINFDIFITKPDCHHFVAVTRKHLILHHLAFLHLWIALAVYSITTLHIYIHMHTYTQLCMHVYICIHTKSIYIAVHV